MTKNADYVIVVVLVVAICVCFDKLSEDGALSEHGEFALRTHHLMKNKNSSPAKLPKKSSELSPEEESNPDELSSPEERSGLSPHLTQLPGFQNASRNDTTSIGYCGLKTVQISETHLLSRKDLLPPCMWAASRQEVELMIKEVPRPSWMDLPPSIDMLIPEPRSESAEYGTFDVALVSYADGKHWEPTLDYYKKKAGTCKFSKQFLWKRNDVLQFLESHDSTHSTNFRASLDWINSDENKTKIGRKDCNMGKPVTMWNAIFNMKEGDWVVFCDSSQYFAREMIDGVDIHKVIEAVQNKKRGVTALDQPPLIEEWGKQEWMKEVEKAINIKDDLELFLNVHYPKDWSGNYPALNDLSNFSEVVASEYAEFLENEDYVRRNPHVLNSCHMMKNTPFNRLFVWDWLQVVVKKSMAWCLDHTQDQLAHVMLLYSRMIPITNTYVYGPQQPKQKKATAKLGSTLFKALLDQTYEVMYHPYAFV